MEIHGFADASERAYAAVVYLHVSTGDFWTSNIVAAKSKVAPLKPVSLPRLELSAATLLVRLVNHIRSIISSGASSRALMVGLHRRPCLDTGTLVSMEDVRC